jgi:hypothetical protein
MQQPTANDVIEMSRQTDIRQDCENVQKLSPLVAARFHSLVGYLTDMTFRSQLSSVVAARLPSLV